ncbi:hypothetical protein ZYGR_0AG00880 [Zygosaccharomyces rouxii]|uniref:Formate/nitrite transporter n=1 Tax=Zygosaccharomyces rouxii TaxID=4956 RepID=A0A1Q3A8S9_ZYGRO|nr:hypothetical protein ZYGR_0AG00880 [Zygosaccharomyces rouxii]
MVVEDSTYITPHEAALAVEATSMKKARMQLDVLILNSVIAGIVFGSGGVLNVAAHSQNPGILAKNPGVLDFLGGILYGIGLFYVIILGVDLFNSNILYFSVGLLRRSVSIYDLLISWLCSLLGNIGGCLLLCYVFVHVSSVGTSYLWKVGSKKLAEEKASFSFIQTFLKGIAGNFYVCLAIYLQLMAKPLHVKWILITLPIFTFSSIGFSHVVADMPPLFIGMLNGANVSVGKYIWKLLVPASIGNILGGFAFSLLIPFYLHLVVVERDRKKLSLPQYEERDEQPELNMDSRVVRVQPGEEQYDEEQAEEEKEENGEKVANVPGRNSMTSSRSVHLSSADQSSHSDSFNSFDVPEALENNSCLTFPVKKWKSNRSGVSLNTTSSTGLRKRPRATPAGVFPVRGMANPLRDGDGRSQRMSDNATVHGQSLGAGGSVSASPSRRGSSLRGSFARSTNTSEDGVENNKVVDSKPGAKLEKAITRIISRVPSRPSKNELPRTTQEALPYSQQPPSYFSNGLFMGNRRGSGSVTSTRSVQRRNSTNIPKAKLPSVQRNSRLYKTNTRTSDEVGPTELDIISSRNSGNVSHLPELPSRQPD